MATYPSPISLAEFQAYLHDTSTDSALLTFFQSLLDSATEYVYNWLDRDFTASAVKTDVFWGDDSPLHASRNPVGTLLNWFSYDASGNETDHGTSDLLLRASGMLIQSKTQLFASAAEHHLTYQQPGTLTCPETVRQVIMEIAAVLFAESNRGAGSLGILMTSIRDGSSTDRERYLDLTIAHKDMLHPYRRLPV